jgi:uncharacterized protein (UPF0332 family)
LLPVNGDYESSVLRSYYAMFYCVQALLLTKGLTVSSHAGLNTVFSEQFVKTGLLPKHMRRELNPAFEKRQLGDYESAFVLSEDEAKEVLEKAQGFTNNCIDYLKQTGNL